MLDKSGYLEELRDSKDPQDETRLENLVELINVAREFVSGGRACWPSSTRTPRPTWPSCDRSCVLDPAVELAAGAAEPDPSLGAFLERVALVADSDQIPTDGADQGVVTLMTLHTAKGLEFDNVFLTGLEDGVFPHQRALTDKSELAEERRLAYVGITRARKRLHISRAIVRTAWGSPQHNPPSRFLDEIPDRLIDWRRTERAVTSWRNSSATTVPIASWRIARSATAAPKLSAVRSHADRWAPVTGCCTRPSGWARSSPPRARATRPWPTSTSGRRA